MSKYIRTTIKTFSELPKDLQYLIAKDWDGEQSEMYESQFVRDPLDTKNYLPLNMFMRMEGSKLWSGVYGLSYFSAYFIKIDARGNDVCTVGYRHW